MKGDALEWGITFGNAVVAGGDAEIGSCATNGTYLQVPHPNNGRSDCDGKGAGDASNVDINNAWTQFTDAQMAWSATPSCNGTLSSASVDSSTLTPAFAKIGNNTGDTRIRISPNPVSNQFTVSLEGFTTSSNIQLIIYNNQGAPVHIKDLQRNRTATLRVKDWSKTSGIYYLRATGGNKTAIEKLVVTE